MLRITIDEGKDAVVLRLEAQLIGPWVEDVEQCWRKAFETLGSRSLQLDLSAVDFVDASGGARLIRTHAAGFRLAGSTPATGHFLDQITERSHLGRELIPLETNRLAQAGLFLTHVVRGNRRGTSRTTFRQENRINTPYGLEIVDKRQSCRMKREECFCNLSPRY